ncbi:BRO1 domain-containing protein [Paraphysoderma sedebokerense]|nr:BRO1 domain-containing protein [Paraphysoderma sedebokerense]
MAQPFPVLYSFSPSSTLAISFAQFLAPSPVVSSQNIGSLSSSRDKIRLILKDHPEAHVDLFRAIEDYLPHLLGLIETLNNEEAKSCLQVPLEFTWKSSLSKGKIKPNITMSMLDFELCYVLLIYGFALNNTAAQSVQKCHKDDVDTKFPQAADYLLRAAGVYDHIHSNVSSKLVNLPAERPPEILKEAVKALSLISLADAQLLAIYKALIKSPPKSPLLLVKLLVDVTQKFESANSSLQSMKFDYNDISENFRGYVRDKSILTLSIAKKLLGMEAFRENKFGLSVAFLKDSRDKLNSIKNSDSKFIEVAVKNELPEIEKLLAQ